MTVERARQLSGAYLYEDREYVDGRIKDACGRGHYRVWIQEYELNNVEQTKEFYRSMGFHIIDREGGSIKEFLISWE